MYYVTILHPSTTWIDTMWANVATYYQQLKELSLRQSLTTGMIMTRPVWPWSPWHLLETLSTCLTISPTASTAPQTVRLSSSNCYHHAHLLCISISQDLQLFQTHLLCAQVAYSASQALAHQSLAVVNQTQSSPTLWFQVSKQSALMHSTVSAVTVSFQTKWTFDCKLLFWQRSTSKQRKENLD